MKMFRSQVILSLAALCSPLLLATGCAGGGASAFTNPPVVSAQQTYTTATLIGTYSVKESGSNGTQLHDGTGSLHLDGNGNVTGTLTDYYIGGSPCQFALTGTYTVSSSASGTGTFSSTTTNSACTGNAGTFTLQVGQQGQAFVFAENDGQRLSSGTALKQ